MEDERLTEATSALLRAMAVPAVDSETKRIYVDEAVILIHQSAVDAAVREVRKQLAMDKRLGR